ncbi:MAG: hypothetical protein JW699_06160 [Chitinispirillaceae bacterium]|nr:hypothetical protein [Chitinispirillaceae bacterium]
MKRLFIVSILLLSSAAVSAADLKDFSIYGSVRMGTWLDRVEKFTSDTINPLTPPFTIGADPHPDFHFNIVPHGKIGLKYRGDNIGATFELYARTALNNAYLSGFTGFTIYRWEKYYAEIYRFFATWRLNDRLTFLAGQDYVPICFFSSDQMFYDNNSFGNTGSLWGGRKPMLEMIYSTMGDADAETTRDASGFEARLAAIKVDTCSVRYYDQWYPLTATKFPKVEASCENKFSGPVKADIKIAGGFQQYDLVQLIGDVASGSYDSIQRQPVNCYVGGVHAGITFGPMTLMGDFATGQNWGPYGLYIGNPFVFRGHQMSYLVNVYYPSFTPDTIPGGLVENNSTATEADVVLRFKALPSLSFETGFGWVHASHTDSTVAANWHDNMAVYFQSVIKVRESVIFTPEIGMYFYGPQEGYGRMMYAGFGTRIDF